MDGRETLEQLQSRVLSGMRVIQQAHPGHSVLIVTHVAIIRVVSLFANKQDLNSYKKVPVDNAKVFNFAGLDL
jgi:broad specificity phosphatase PhoE